MVGDAVEELRPQPSPELPLQLVDLEPVLVHRNGDELRLEASKRLDRAQIGGAFDDDQIAGIEVRLADELERLDATARDQQLVVGGTAALQPLEPVRERVEWPGQTARRRVLERADLAGGGELLQERGHPLAWERGRVREAARKGDQVGQAEERQDRRDPLADVAPGARAASASHRPVSGVTVTPPILDVSGANSSRYSEGGARRCLDLSADGGDETGARCGERRDSHSPTRAVADDVLRVQAERDKTVCREPLRERYLVVIDVLAQICSASEHERAVTER